MAESIPRARAVEDEYYGGMSEDAKMYANLRNVGFNLVRSTIDEESAYGMSVLGESVSFFQGAGDFYQRELFASLYMLSRGAMLNGEYNLALASAASAMGNRPNPPTDIEEQMIGDQYLAIGTPKISAILNATKEETRYPTWASHYEDLAKEAAHIARATCPHSEDPGRMLFTDGEMTEAERKRVRRRHTLAAAGASAGVWLPLPQSSRMILAKAICR